MHACGTIAIESDPGSVFGALVTMAADGSNETVDTRDCPRLEAQRSVSVLDTCLSSLSQQGQLSRVVDQQAPALRRTSVSSHDAEDRAAVSPSVYLQRE